MVYLKIAVKNKEHLNIEVLRTNRVFPYSEKEGFSWGTDGSWKSFRKGGIAIVMGCLHIELGANDIYLWSVISKHDLGARHENNGTFVDFASSSKVKSPL